MNRQYFGICVCLAWAAAAVATVSPAHAVAITPQVGSYASCSSSYQATISQPWCGGYVTNYGQVIKLISQACNTGSCSGMDTTFTSIVYPSGRTVTQLIYNCGYNVYNLSTCAC